MEKPRNTVTMQTFGLIAILYVGQALGLTNQALPSPLPLHDSGAAWNLAQGKPGTQSRPPKSNKGVRALFESAQEFYKAGKYPAATAAFENILRRYPGHQPTILQLAKSYYRQDRIKDAYHTFNRVPSADFDPESSYEYGYAAYQQKNFETCQNTLRNIPDGHSLFDLAQYYQGICLLKLKRYKDAEVSFEKATVLPDKIAKSRGIYLKHIEAILVNQESQKLAQERRLLFKEPKSAKTTSKKSPSPEKPTLKPAPATPPSYQGFKGTGKSANVGMVSENQSIDYHGNKHETFESTSGSFSLSTTPHFFLSPKPSLKDRFGAIGLTIGLGASSATIKGKQQRILLDENDDSIQRNLTNTLPTKDEKKGSWSLEPWIEVPLPLNLWIATGLSLKMDFPDLERGKRSGTQEVYTSLGGKNGPLGYGTVINYVTLIDAKNAPKTAILGLQIHGAMDLTPLMAVTGILRYENYQYPDPDARINGADSVIRGEADIVQSFPLGFSIRFAGLADTEINKLTYDMPTYDVIAANAINLTGLGSLLYGGVPGGPGYPGRSGRPEAIWPFFNAGITVLAKQTIWNVAEKETEEVFKLNVPNYVEQVKGELSIGLSF